jgi:hypothetical protein
MKVYTSLRLVDQKAALSGVRLGMLEFQRRRGYAGPEGQLKLPADGGEADKVIESALLDREESSGFLPGVVLAIDRQRIRVRLRSGDDIDLGASEIKFAERFLSTKLAKEKRLGRGSVVRVARVDPGAPVAVDLSSPGGSGVRGPRSQEWRHPGHGGGIRFLAQPVQPRDPGLAPGGFQLQALHLLRRAGTRHHAGLRVRRRAHHHRPGGNGRRGLGAEELRWDHGGPDDPAFRPGQIQEPDLHPGPAGRRRAIRP